MVRVRLINLKFASLWWAVAGVVVGYVVISNHSLMATSSERALIWSDITGGIEEYLLFGGATFGLFWLVLHRWMRNRQISRKRWPKPLQIVREVAFSLSSQIVMTAFGLYLVVSTPLIVGNIMTEVSPVGWIWVGLFTFLLFAMEDTAFYWSHRAMHHPRLFRFFHRVHHDSHDPTPFTAYSFHPVEAIVQSLNGMPGILLLTVVPWHPASLIIYGFGNIAFNIIGHLGYEIYPANWNRWPVLRWKTPGLHHYLHHQMVGGNYGLYFRWWDRWCGTEFADFEARYDQIFARPSLQSPALLHTNFTGPGQTVLVD